MFIILPILWRIYSRKIREFFVLDEILRYDSSFILFCSQVHVISMTISCDVALHKLSWSLLILGYRWSMRIWNEWLRVGVDDCWILVFVIYLRIRHFLSVQKSRINIIWIDQSVVIELIISHAIKSFNFLFRFINVKERIDLTRVDPLSNGGLRYTRNRPRLCQAYISLLGIILVELIIGRQNCLLTNILILLSSAVLFQLMILKISATLKLVLYWSLRGAFFLLSRTYI